MMKYTLLSLVIFLLVTFLYTLPSFYIYDIHRIKYVNDTLVFLEDKFSRLMPSAVVVDPKQVFMTHNPKMILKITADFNFADLASKVCYNSEYQPICTQTALFFEYGGNFYYADHFGNFWVGCKYPFRIDKSTLWRSYLSYRHCRGCISNYPHSDAYSIPNVPFVVNLVIGSLPFQVSFSNMKYTLYNEQPLSFFYSCYDVLRGCSFSWSVPFNAFVFAYHRSFTYCDSSQCNLYSICAESFSPFNLNSYVGTKSYGGWDCWWGACDVASSSHYVRCYSSVSFTYNYTMIPSNSLWAYNNYTYLYRITKGSRWYCHDWNGPMGYWIYDRFCYITSGHPSTGKPNVVFYPLEDFSGAFYCGDHICSLSAGENKENCPEDCSFKEGDGICQVNIGENYGNSPEDCLYACNDGYCSPKENSYICPEDCSDICGDHFCNPNANENCHTCPTDCGPCTITCGDGYCTYPNETVLNCPADCRPICGDGYCSESEDPISCPADCPGAYSKNDRLVSSLLSALLLAQTAFLGGRKL